MIPEDCKRLAEVDFPIAEVSRHAPREKYIRDTPNTALHTWWAQRPLAACRAVLLGLLLPDPCDPLCPKEFKAIARELLPQIQGSVGGTDAELRSALLRFIGEFANWDVAANQAYLAISRHLVRSAHGDEPPLVVDPFAGAGSIPFEALRLGCDVFASDLNPVACTILKVMLEDVPRHGPGLVAELRRAAASIKKELQKETSQLYTQDPDGAQPTSYFWARTVRCESPNCGAEIPLVRSFWLCQKVKRRRALRCRVDRRGDGPPRVEFEVFEPRNDKEVPEPVVAGAKATCIACGSVLPADRTRAQLSAERGAGDVIFDAKGRRTGGARMLAVATLRGGESVRQYRLPTESDYKAVRSARLQLEHVLGEWEGGRKEGLCPVPNEPLPPVGTLGFRVQRYGMLEWGDLFTARQKLALVGISARIASANKEYSPVVARLLACAMGKFARHCNQNARWNNVIESVEPAFGQGTLPMNWAFPETVLWGPWAENFDGAVDAVVRCLERGFLGVSKIGQVELADATASPLSDSAASVWFTDPPYYDAIPYADLSDFFFVWLKRALPADPILHDPFDLTNTLTPKQQEAVQDETRRVGGRPKDRTYFEAVMRQSFGEGRRVLRDGGVGAVVFAHKTTEGWEALLSGLIEAGWTITGSWPIATERKGRLRARDSAALATSVHLVCRPRTASVAIGDWAIVLRQLPQRVGEWMERLQREGVRGADLVFACIGPALEIFSRYVKVETAEGREVKLGEYLEKVWEVVGRSALAQVLGTDEARARNGAAGAVEEDARLTALFLWTVQSTNAEAAEGTSAEGEEEGVPDEDEDEERPSKGKAKGPTLIFDVVRRFAQPLGIELPKWEGRVIETKKGIVRLLPIAERAKQLFGEDGAQAVAARLEREASTPNSLQGMLFPEKRPGAPTAHGRGRGRGKRVGGAVADSSLVAAGEATTLDRVHAAMLLQKGGRTNALRSLLKAEQERSPDFLRLANALSALYPKGSEEKRLLDAMLLAVVR